MGINERIHKILEQNKVKFVDPKPEKEAEADLKEKDWAKGIVYVDDPRIPQEFLRKIEKKYGPIPKGSYFSGNFSMYWEKLEPDYGGEVNTGGRSVSNQYRLPNINNVYRQFKKLNDQLDFLKDNKDIMKDEGIQKVFQQIRDSFNSYRTYIRKNYPENYETVKEISTTGGGAGAAGFTPGEGMGYATPYAFTGGKKAKEPLALKKLGYKIAKNE